MFTQSQACTGMLILSCAILLTSCGGGGGSDSTTSNSSTNTTSVSSTPAGQALVSTHTVFAVYTGNANQQDDGGSPFVDDPNSNATFNVTTTSTPADGSVSLSGTQFLYQPSTPDFTGYDSFNYTVTDSTNHSINGTALVRSYGTANHNACTQASTVNTNGTLATRDTAGKCAIYGEVITRHDVNGNPVTVRYIALRPADGKAPKAVVFMIGGGDLNMNITGDAGTGAITTTGGNYVVRSAQIMADGDYLVIAMDRPTDLDTATTATDPIADIDAYRISVDQAIDILAVTHQVNGDHLPLFLDGTSRGTISVFANNLIANGIALSSPLTTDATAGHDPIGAAGINRLQPSYDQRPTYLAWHQDDQCSLTPPAGSQQLLSALQNNGNGISVTPYTASGGVRVTTASGNVTPNPCGAFDYHGFMGIEPTVMGDNVKAFDTMYANLFGAGNHIPSAAFTTLSTPSNTPLHIALDSLTQDSDGDSLSYTLPHTSTSLGGSVSLNGNSVTYTPPAGVSKQTDEFVYVVKDTNGGVNAALVSVQIGN